MTDHEDKYDRIVDRLRAMFSRALEGGELPAELLPENQDTSDVELDDDLEDLIVRGDEAALRERAEEEMLCGLGGLNRGEEDEDDADLNDAREQLRRRRAEQEEDEGAPPPSPDAR